MCHSVATQKALFLVVVVRRAKVLFVLIGLLMPLLAFTLGVWIITLLCFGAPSTFESRPISLSWLILSKLRVSLSAQLRVQFILNCSIGSLDLQKHLFGDIIVRVQVRMKFLCLVKVRLLDFIELLTSGHTEQKVRILKLFLSRSRSDWEKSTLPNE